MSSRNGPKVNNTGLVFAYDTYNNDKSWKGAPTTNLADVSISGMSGVSLTYLGMDGNWKKYSMSGTFTGGTYPFILGITAISFTAGTTYSSSCYIKTNVLSKFNYFGTGMNYVNQPMNKSGTSFSILQTDGSFYIGRSNFAYTATTTQTGYILSNPINNTTFNSSTDFVWIKEGQIELGEFPTPFVKDTRYANLNLESTPNFPTWNQAASSASAGTLTFTAGSYTSKGNWDLYKTYSGLSTATNYTWSALVKLGTATNLILTMNNTQTWNTGPSKVFTHLNSTKWKRISITGTTNFGSFNIHLGASANSEVTNEIQSSGTVLIKDVKFQLTGAKTALMDLTGNNTINVNSLTYNSDGTFNFNGTSNFLTCGNNSAISDISGTTAVSVEAWVNLSGYGSSGYGVITHKGNPWAWLMENPNNRMRIRFGLSVSGDVACDDSTTHLLNTWYHFVGTYDGTNMRFYRNGELRNTVAATGTLGGTGINMVVGNYSGAYYSQGQIPVIKIYNRTLSSAEIKQHFNALRSRYLLA